MFSVKYIPSLIVGMAAGFSLSLTPYAKTILMQGEKAKKATFSEIKKQLLKVGVPQFLIPLEREGYICNYNPNTRNPLWTYEHLTAKGLQPNTTKALFKFTEDLMIPEIFRVKLDDFHGSIYERAHLCPPADQRFDHKTLGETFLLSNISPQIPELKQGVWKNLEKQIREWTSSYQSLDVFTGPLFLPNFQSREGPFVQYPVIGDSQVAVPTHFFKVVRAVKGRKEFDLKCYLVPNEPIEEDIPLEEFEVALEEIERASGLKFFTSGTFD